MPNEILLKPGQVVQFKATSFNALGQKLKAEAAVFSVDKSGQITPAGAFTAKSDATHTTATITAKLGELTGTARVRIVPPLPWKFDFNDVEIKEVENPVTKAKSIEGEPPITWVGARHRHKVREVAGEKVMTKISTIPRGARSQMWMGPWDLTNYTIQADVRGAAKKGTVQTDQGPQENFVLPDIGLINMRYTLDLMGQSQQLQLRSWTSQIKTRFSKNVPFTWKADKWYSLKFSAYAENGQAILQGKVWGARPAGTEGVDD